MPFFEVSALRPFRRTLPARTAIAPVAAMPRMPVAAIGPIGALRPILPILPVRTLGALEPVHLLHALNALQLIGRCPLDDFRRGGRGWRHRRRRIGRLRRRRLPGTAGRAFPTDGRLTLARTPVAGFRTRVAGRGVP